MNELSKRLSRSQARRITVQSGGDHRDLVTCDRCGGRGEVTIRKFGLYGDYVCVKCHGSGLVLKSEPIDP